MSIRYVSCDPRTASDHDLSDFVKKHHGKAISEALYRFNTDASLGAFRDELCQAVANDDAVYIIIRTKDGLEHGSPVRRHR